MKYLVDMIKLVRKNKFTVLFVLICLFSLYPCWAKDFPIERDFLRLPDRRWIWLEKIDWHKTRVILGKGKKSFKNHIWSKIYETDGRHHTWAYAFFVRIKPGQFIESATGGKFRVAISTTDLGNNMIRYVIIYKVMKDRLEIEKEISGYNTAADGPVFLN